MTERLIILHERINLLKAELEASKGENWVLRELVSRWLEFAVDVRPSCMAGEEWLEVLRVESENALNKP